MYARGRVVLAVGCLLVLSVRPALAQTSAGDRSRPFRIQVVDEETGRGVPLVELRTVNNIRLVTDSNGIAAFDEPGLMGLRVFFDVKSHGYEFPKDGFGFRGAALDTQPGGSASLKIRRLNVARRLYRVTGAGIYRDSILTGTPVPIREPLLNGQVLGQDSVLTAVFQGKIQWFWGDTNRPGYPLGNFHVPGAISELPGKGGLDPELGVDLAYHVDPRGFARPTCEMPGPGPTWISGLVVLKDRRGRERMFANYVKIRPPLETYERGLVEFDAEKRIFVKRAQFSRDLATYPGEHPGGHTLLDRRREGEPEFIYYCNPYPLVRLPADPDQLGDGSDCEAFSCLQPGTRFEQRKLDREPDGRLRYAWKKKTGVLNQEQQAKLVKEGLLKPEESLLSLRDVLTGKTVLAHGGSVSWNAYRGRWVMILVELMGTSFLGEVWYAEADTPLGPWVHARKIVTHEDYSFYNPKHHPMFDKEGGRIIHFEGTYTTTFSGSKDPTPRYDYNQVMYQLDLADRRLALPVAIFAVESETHGRASRLTTRTASGLPARIEEIAFFAPDRPGMATLPVRISHHEGSDDELIVGPIGDSTRPDPEARPMFWALPADAKDSPAGTISLHEYRQDSGHGRYYATGDRQPRPGFRKLPEAICLVWKNPSRIPPW